MVTGLIFQSTDRTRNFYFIFFTDRLLKNPEIEKHHTVATTELQFKIHRTYTTHLNCHSALTQLTTVFVLFSRCVLAVLICEILKKHRVGHCVVRAVVLDKYFYFICFVLKFFIQKFILLNKNFVLLYVRVKLKNFMFCQKF